MCHLPDKLIMLWKKYQQLILRIGTINIHQYLSNILVHEQCTLPAVRLKKWRKDTGDFEDSIIVGCDGLFGFLVQSHTKIHL